MRKEEKEILLKKLLIEESYLKEQIYEELERARYKDDKLEYIAKLQEALAKVQEEKRKLTVVDAE